MRMIHGVAWPTTAILVLAMAGTGLPALAGAATLTPVTIGLTPRISNAPIVIAIEEGYFAQQGIEVRQADIRESTLAWPALIAGQIDVYAGAYSPAFLEAVRRGARLRIVAEKGHSGPGDRANAFMVRQDLIDSGRFKTFRDLRGMRVAVPTRATMGEFIMERLLRNRAFLTESAIQYVTMPPALTLDAFKARVLDAGWISEPLVTRLEQLNLARVVITYQEIVPNSPYAFLIYGPRMLVRNPGLGQRVMNAYLRGVQEYNKGKTDRNVAIIARWTGDEEALVRKMSWPLISADGHFSLETLMQLQAWWVRNGYLDQIVPPAQFSEPALARRAYRLLTSGR